MSNLAKMQSDAKYRSARASLLLIVIFSAVNIFSIAFAESYFLFASYFTQMIVAVGTVLYAESGMVLYLAVAASIAILSVVPYFLMWLFSKKHPGAMIAALVLFSLDSVLFLFDFLALIAVGDLSLLTDLIIRIWALGSLIAAVKYGLQAKKMAEAESTPEAPADFYEDEPDFAYADHAMISRAVTIERPKRFAAMAVHFDCIVDGCKVAELKNGKSVTLTLDGNAHELIVSLPNGSAMGGVDIPAGDTNKVYAAEIKMGAFSNTIRVAEKGLG